MQVSHNVCLQPNLWFDCEDLQVRLDTTFFLEEGRNFVHQGKILDAKKAFESGLLFAPQNEELLYQLGRLHDEDLADKVVARAYFDSVLMINPHHVSARVGLMNLHKHAADTAILDASEVIHHIFFETLPQVDHRITAQKAAFHLSIFAQQLAQMERDPLPPLIDVTSFAIARNPRMDGHTWIE
ncbi:MAG: hypothetical protein JWO53_170 [Chlamydiia bacterium]|nr:hypothetical protein [Chlamydiia bacterium]